jgi:methylenetetrahydrofolate dehydrogenase (NADP+)/methenyltetrahydrofolate cyclohydrolase
MSEWLKGHILAKNIQEKVAARVAQIGQPLGLGVILVGADPASTLYVSLKEKSAKEAGIYVEKHHLPETTKQKEVLELIASLNNRTDIHGILVQFPLPKHLDESEIIAAIDVNKDVDGFKQENLEKLQNGEPSLAPPVALAILKLIGSSLQPLRNKTAIIISNSEIFSKPIIALMKEQGLTGTYLAPSTPALANMTKVADILVVAVGKINFIKTSMVSPHAILIDVGTNRTKKGLRGDITNIAKEKAAFATPVPGGVGPLTVAYLLLNVLKAYELQKAELKK